MSHSATLIYLFLNSKFMALSETASLGKPSYKHLLKVIKEHLRKDVQEPIIHKVDSQLGNWFVEYINQELETFAKIHGRMLDDRREINDRTTHQLMGKVLLLAHYLDACDYAAMSRQLRDKLSQEQQGGFSTRNMEMQEKLNATQSLLEELAGDVLSRYQLNQLRKMLNKTVPSSVLVRELSEGDLVAGNRQKVEGILWGGVCDGPAWEQLSSTEITNSHIHCDDFSEGEFSDEARIGTLCLRMFFLLFRENEAAIDMPKKQAEKFYAYEEYAGCLSPECREVLTAFACRLPLFFESREPETGCGWRVS